MLSNQLQIKSLCKDYVLGKTGKGTQGTGTQGKKTGDGSVSCERQGNVLLCALTSSQQGASIPGGDASSPYTLVYDAKTGMPISLTTPNVPLTVTFTAA